MSPQAGLPHPDALSVLARTARRAPPPAHRDAGTPTHRPRKATARAHRLHLAPRAPSTASQNRIHPEPGRASRSPPVISASSAFLALPPPHPPDTRRPVRPSSESIPHSRWWPCLSARSVTAAPLARSFPDHPPHRPCSRPSMTTSWSCTKTSCLQAQPSPPSMPCAKKNRHTRTRQSLLIAMCAATVLPVSPVSSLFQAVINSIASLKRRPIPTSISHPSVGTDEDIAARVEARNKLDALRLTRSVLSHLLISTDAMQQCGYMSEIPDGEGGSEPHAVGKITKCERCGQPYLVSDTPAHDECTHHWGRPFSKTINGASEAFMSSSFVSEPYPPR